MPRFRARRSWSVNVFANPDFPRRKRACSSRSTPRARPSRALAAPHGRAFQNPRPARSRGLRALPAHRAHDTIEDVIEFYRAFSGMSRLHQVRNADPEIPRIALKAQDTGPLRCVSARTHRGLRMNRLRRYAQHNRARLAVLSRYRRGNLRFRSPDRSRSRTQRITSILRVIGCPKQRSNVESRPVAWLEANTGTEIESYSGLPRESFSVLRMNCISARRGTSPRGSHRIAPG